MDYIGIISHFIDPIVASKDQIKIEETVSESKKDRFFVIRCTNEDMGRLIGKHGTTANALREVISIAAKNNDERVHIKIVSLETKEEEKVNTEEVKDEENPQ